MLPSVFLPNPKLEDITIQGSDITQLLSSDGASILALEAIAPCLWYL